MHNRSLQKFWLLQAMSKQNDCICSSFLATLWSWIKEKSFILSNWRAWCSQGWKQTDIPTIFICLRVLCRHKKSQRSSMKKINQDCLIVFSSLNHTLTGKSKWLNMKQDSRSISMPQNMGWGQGTGWWVGEGRRGRRELGLGLGWKQKKKRKEEKRSSPENIL